MATCCIPPEKGAKIRSVEFWGFSKVKGVDWPMKVELPKSATIKKGAASSVTLPAAIPRGLTPASSETGD
jgi:hypothetical protein